VILVSGATGNVGGDLVRALVGAGEGVRALTRGAQTPTLPAGVQAATGDLNRPETLSDALAGVHGVFLLAGYEDMPGVMAAIRCARVERVVLLSSGCVADGDMSNAVVRYNALSEAAVRDSGVAWTVLRPSGFMSNALRWLPQLRSGDVVRAPFADVPIAAIDPFDIAAVAAHVLLADGHDGATYMLSGPAPLRPGEQLEVLGTLLGRELRLKGQSNAEARAEMSAAMPAEYVDAMFSFFVDGTFDDSQVRPTVRDLLGREPRTFEQWATAHVDAFR
jgi:uncharacterized protein YbjT (DUF2867 family)